jgi:hypothetical protein
VSPRRRGELSSGPTPSRFRVSRARLAYGFERYAIRDELVSVGEAAALLGLSREVIALLVLRGRLAVAEEVAAPGGRPPRMLVRAEVDAVRLSAEQGAG